MDHICFPRHLHSPLPLSRWRARRMTSWPQQTAPALTIVNVARKPYPWSAKAEFPVDDVARYVREQAVGTERVPSQPDQCLGHADVLLDRDDPGGIVHGEVEVGTDLQ